jgi:replicative DNA helicase
VCPPASPIWTDCWAGLNKSDLVILAGRPGMGKTSLQNGIALTAATRYARRVAIFNLEMSSEQLVQRMLSAQTRIDSQRLRRGQLHEHEWPIFYEAIGRLSERHIYIDDTPSITTEPDAHQMPSFVCRARAGFDHD